MTDIDIYNKYYQLLRLQDLDYWLYSAHIDNRGKKPIAWVVFGTDTDVKKQQHKKVMNKDTF